MIVLSAEFVKSATEPEGYPAAGPAEVAFCGRSNVGKSSCLNSLSNRKALARVSGTPGRTRLINFFDLKVAEKTRTREWEIRFADLPGYGFAAGPRDDRKEWKKMIDRYLVERNELRALVVLVDGEIGPQPNDTEMLDWARNLGRKIIVAATKLDRIAKTRRAAQLDKISVQLGVPGVIGFSAKEHFGVEELWRALLDA